MNPRSYFKSNLIIASFMVTIFIFSVPLFSFADLSPQVVANLKRAHTLQKQKKYMAARMFYVLALEDDDANRFQKGEAQAWIGHCFRKESNHLEALDAYEVVLGMDGVRVGHRSEALLWSGQIYYEQGDLDEARTRFQAVLRMQKKPLGHVRHANMLLAEIGRS